MSVIRSGIASLALFGLACASFKSQPDDELRVVQPKPKRSAYVITREELQDPKISSRDALTAIRHLRPGFFTYRGPNSFMVAEAGTTKISYDYGPIRPLSELATLNTLDFFEVRYLNAEDAQGRFGLNAGGGPVIVLVSNKDAR